MAPTVVDAYDNPVSSVYTELIATEWKPFYDLQEVMVAYESFDSDANFEYVVVLQSVKTDPTQQAPAEDTILSAQSGTPSQTTFTNAANNLAQLCRIVLKAKDNSCTPTADQRGRVNLAVAPGTRRGADMTRRISGAVSPSARVKVRRGASVRHVAISTAGGRV